MNGRTELPCLLLLGVIVVWLILKRCRGRPKSRGDGEGFRVGHVHVGWADSGLAFSGSSGYGKTVAARTVQRQAIRMRLPMVVACPKPTDAGEIEQLCREEGAGDRFVRLRPGSTRRINLLHYLCSVEGGNAQTAGLFLSRLNDISTRAEGANRGESFWMTMFEMALTYAIDLCLIAIGEADMEMVKDAIADSPATPEEADPDKYLETKPGTLDPKNGKMCAKLILAARLNRNAGNQRRVDRATDFFLNEFSSMGHKARGAILAMVNAILGRFLREPFYAALCEETNLTPEDIEKDRLIVALDYDLLTYDTPGRMFQLAWIMIYQAHCLRRDPTNAPRSLLVRDEAPYFTHPDYDAKVAAVSRSQRLIHFDIFQDFDLMEATYGGGPKAKNEAMSWWANHGVKATFHQDDPDSAEINSRLVGDHREIMCSGGGGGGKPATGNWLDDALGVGSRMSWSEQFARRMRPEIWTTLPVGVAVLHAGGRHRYVDFRKKGG